MKCCFVVILLWIQASPLMAAEINTAFTLLHSLRCVDPNTFNCYEIWLDTTLLINEDRIAIEFPQIGTIQLKKVLHWTVKKVHLMEFQLYHQNQVWFDKYFVLVLNEAFSTYYGFLDYHGFRINLEHNVYTGMQYLQTWSPTVPIKNDFLDVQTDKM